MVDNLSAINGQIRVGSKGNTIILVVTLLMLMRQVWHIQGFSSIVGHYNQFRVMAVVNTKGCSTGWRWHTSLCDGEHLSHVA